MSVLVATLAFTAIVALGLVGLAALTLAPFLLTLRVADRRGFGSGRCGALSLLAAVLGLLVVALGVRALGGPSTLAAVVAGAVVAYAAPLAVAVLPAWPPLTGRAGRHEQPPRPDGQAATPRR